MDLQSAMNNEDSKGMQLATEAQNQTRPMSPEHSTNGEGDQEVDFSLSVEAQEARKKQEDFDKISNWMDVTNDPGNRNAAGEMGKFDAGGIPEAGCSKSNPMIKQRTKPLVMSRNRDYLPRRSKTKAYESLKRLLMGYVETPMLLEKRGRRNLKRLNKKRKSSKKTDKSTPSQRWNKKDTKKLRRRKPRSKFTRAKVSKQNSGTSFGSTQSCSTCRSQDSCRCN